MVEPKFDESLATMLERELSSLHGPMMSGENLQVALGYPSQEAFRQAFVRKQIPIPVFAIEHRRGKFALTKDVAIWLASQRQRAMTKRSDGSPEMEEPMN